MIRDKYSRPCSQGSNCANTASCWGFLSNELHKTRGAWNGKYFTKILPASSAQLGKSNQDINETCLAVMKCSCRRFLSRISCRVTPTYKTKSLNLKYTPNIQILNIKVIQSCLYFSLIHVSLYLLKPFVERTEKCLGGVAVATCSAIKRAISRADWALKSHGESFVSVFGQQSYPFLRTALPS